MVRIPSNTNLGLSVSFYMLSHHLAGDVVYLGGLREGSRGPGLQAGSTEEPAPALAGR